MLTEETYKKAICKLVEQIHNLKTLEWIYNFVTDLLFQKPG